MSGGESRVLTAVVRRRVTRRAQNHPLSWHPWGVRGSSNAWIGPSLAGVLDPVLDVLDDRATSLEAHVRIRDARAGRVADWPAWVPTEVMAALVGSGVHRLWAHQAQAAELVWGGRHVVVSTGPSSGKTLCYAVPALSAALSGATTLYLSPTTALAADQADRLRRLDVAGVTLSAVDGDTAQPERRWARERAHLMLCTPDLVHHSVLPGHERWRRFLSRLRFVVVDECHAYRGVFGAHVSAVLRRLLRLAARYGADPVVIACSATAADPAPFAKALCGVEVEVVDDDAAPHPQSAMIVHVPDSAAGESADVMAALVSRGLQTAAFTASRRGAETMARRAQRRLDHGSSPVVHVTDQASPSASPTSIVSYRGGHLAQERRAVEAGLRERSVLGVATTSALEVGVDVTGLDVVLLDGWPGSITSLHQRAGRAGRGERSGVTVLVAGDDPIDSHLAAHPDAMLSRPVEAGVTDVDNPYVLAPHLALAAMESPLTADDLAMFGPAAPDVVAALTERGDLRHRPAGWFWARGAAPAPVDIRSTSGRPVTLIESGTGRVLGTVAEARALEVAHPDAVYLHRHDTYLVDSLDLDEGVAMLHAEDPGWITVPKRTGDVAILGQDTQRECRGARLTFGTVSVTRRVVGFVRRDPVTGLVLGEERLDLPERSFLTRAVSWLPAGSDAGTGPSDAALHAAEHVLVAMLPMVVPCDTWDVAAHCAVASENGPARVTVHDAWPGGAGFAERAFSAAQEWLAAAADRLIGCECAAGCPSCVIQVGCERRNHGLDKFGAARLLG